MKKCTKCGGILQSERELIMGMCSNCEMGYFSQQNINIKHDSRHFKKCKNCGATLRSKRTRSNGVCSYCEEL